MTSVEYKEIYSRMFSKIQAYDLIQMGERDASDFLMEWLHSAFARPDIRRLFSTFKFDDDYEEINYEMKYPMEFDYDHEFVIEVIAINAVLRWIEHKTLSITNILQFYGSKEEKFTSQAAHLSQLEALRERLDIEYKRLIGDRNSMWNTYVEDYV